MTLGLMTPKWTLQEGRTPDAVPGEDPRQHEGAREVEARRVMDAAG